MHADEDRRVAADVTDDERERRPALHAGLVRIGDELTELRGKLRRRHTAHELLLAHAVLDQRLDRNHLELIETGELVELRQPRHPTVVVEHFADDSGGVAASEPGQIDGGLGVAGPAEDAARHRAQREDMSGGGQVAWPHGRVDQCANRHRAVVGGGPGRHAATRIDGDRERRPHRRRVVRHHHPDLELVEAVAQHRHADEATAELGHEVHRFRCGLLRRHHEVALVLAILVVDDDEDPPLADFLDGLVDGGERGHDAPLNASDRCRYLPITSISTFTTEPSASTPIVAPASLCGITITSKVVISSAATVRLTPSTATEPCAISSGASSRSPSANRTLAVDSTRSTRWTVATPSTCPSTRWPPSVPPNRSGRSRFTRRPARSRFNAVRRKVSGPTSKTRPSASRSTTVKHTPLTARLEPIALSSRAALAVMPSRAPTPRRPPCLTVPR